MPLQCSSGRWLIGNSPYWGLLLAKYPSFLPRNREHGGSAGTSLESPRDTLGVIGASFGLSEVSAISQRRSTPRRPPQNGRNGVTSGTPFRTCRKTTERGGFDACLWQPITHCRQTVVPDSEPQVRFLFFAGLCQSLPFLRLRSGTHLGTQPDARLNLFLIQGPVPSSFCAACGRDSGRQVNSKAPWCALSSRHDR